MYLDEKQKLNFLLMIFIMSAEIPGLVFDISGVIYGMMDGPTRWRMSMVDLAWNKYCVERARPIMSSVEMRLVVDGLDILRFTKYYMNIAKMDLFEAVCKSGNIELTKVLIRKIHMLMELGFEAFRHGNHDIINTIMNREISNWSSGLGPACKSGCLDVVNAIIHEGTPTGGSKCKLEWCIGLQRACENGDKTIVRMMIDKCDKDDWDSGLYGACAGNHMELAELMIEKGADDYDHALYVACEHGHMDMAKMMIARAVRVNSGLVGAILGNHYEIIDMLISKGANAWGDGLRTACKSGNLPVAHLMLTKGVINVQNCLYSACEGGNMAVVQLIIDAINPDLVHLDWNSGLRGACYGGHIEIIEMMIQKGANDFNPGFYAVCETDHIDLVKMFLEKAYVKYDLNRALHIACGALSIDVVYLLINSGATRCACGKEVGKHFDGKTL